MRIEPKFKGVELVTSIFGGWPTFHDAEIKWMHFDRLGQNDKPGPTLEFLLHCFEMTKEVSEKGFYVLKKHTLVHFRAGEVSEAELNGFNHQNVIFGLEFRELPGALPEERSFEVTILPCFGLNGTFRTSFPEILSATSCDEKGNIINK